MGMACIPEYIIIIIYFTLSIKQQIDDGTSEKQRRILGNLVYRTLADASCFSGNIRNKIRWLQNEVEILNQNV